MNRVSAINPFEQLENTAKLIPARIYWLDANNIIVGGNEQSLEYFGKASLNEIIGKHISSLYQQSIVDVVAKQNNEVIQTGRTLSLEEEVRDSATKKTKGFNVVKAPLYDESGKIVGVVANVIDITTKEESEQQKQAKIFKHLEKVAQIIPTPIYWFDINSVVLGGNANALKGVSGTSLEDFIGKTPYEYCPINIAKDIVKYNNEVIKTGAIISKEEAIKDVVTGEVKSVVSIKAPLRDDDGKTIGIIGVSLDITSEKEAASLKLESELHKSQLQEQEKLKAVADQLAHDIRSPLASLLMVAQSCREIPETARIALREAATAIGDIANSLLSRYKPKIDHPPATTDGVDLAKPIAVAVILSQILTDKRYQYQNQPVKFTADFSPAGNFAFIKVQPVAFKRMLSNLINNAVDACHKRRGNINVALYVQDSSVVIKLQDNGKGMPQEVVDKIVGKIAVTNDKPNGHGIGLTQVHDTLQHNKGAMAIDSIVGQGTTITLTFPMVAPPNWLAEKITFYQGDTIVILDDDPSIHKAWDTRLKNYEHAVTIKHFTSGQEAINFISHVTAKEKILLLSDFELLHQELNGLQVIQAVAIDRSILVTSHYSNAKVIELAERCKTKILPKQLTSEVTIGFVEGSQQKKVDLVIVDDDKMLTDGFAMLLQEQKVEVYNHPRAFLEHLNQYPKETKICLDNNLRCDITGLELVQQLHNKGYTKLFLFSGSDFDSSALPEYLTVIGKTDIEAIVKLAKD